MKKVILLAAAVVFLSAGCNKAQTPQVQQQQTQEQPQTENQQQTESRPPAPQENNKPKDEVPAAGKITVKQTVEGSNLNQPGYQIEQGKNAMDLLKSTHQVQVKTFSGLGEFVEAIDGIKPDTNHFWSFYVNDKSSNIGASSYVLKNGDKIGWKLEEIK